MSNILGLSGGTGKFILYILAVNMFLEIRKKGEWHPKTYKDKLTSVGLSCELSYPIGIKDS